MEIPKRDAVEPLSTTVGGVTVDIWSSDLCGLLLYVSGNSSCSRELASLATMS